MLTQATACEFIKQVTALKVFSEFLTAILYCKYMTLKPFSHSFSSDEGSWTNRASVTVICTSGRSTDGPIVLTNKRRSVVLYSQIGSDMTWAASPGYTAALSDDYLSICLLENGCSVQACGRDIDGVKEI